jgi:hypothetical protein
MAFFTLIDNNVLPFSGRRRTKRPRASRSRKSQTCCTCMPRMEIRISFLIAIKSNKILENKQKCMFEQKEGGRERGEHNEK